MDQPIDQKRNGLYAATLEGSFADYSTEPLHHHPYHQILLIKNGVTLLEGEDQKQPLFGNMTAFIPADFRHRSTVIGDQVLYKSLYLKKDLFYKVENQVRIFDISDLGHALFNRLDLPWGGSPLAPLMQDCLSLFLKILDEDIKNPAHLVQVPKASDPHNQKIVEFIEENYQRKLRLSDFAGVVPYSVRHLCRLFKQDLNLTVMDYLKLYRILTSAVLLQTQHKSITEIAYDCGYDSLSCFYVDFRTIFPCTPKRFLQQFG